MGLKLESQVVSMADRAYVVDRGHRIRESRTYEVDRKSILQEAVWKAAETGYDLNRASLPKQQRFDEFKAKWRDDHADTPTSQFWVEFFANGHHRQG